MSAYFIYGEHMVKCPHCNNEVREEEAIYNTKTKRYYHEACYQELLNRKALCDYVCSLFNYKKPSVKIYQQMNSYYERGISYADMLLTLKYFYEIEKNDVNKSQGGIGIIPYALDRAKEYISLEEIEKNKLIEKFERKATEIKETKTIIVKEKPKEKNRKNIDIDTL